jgi:thiamine-phosphate pyrophosphorylase
MARLPFSRVAILDPELVFTDPHALQMDRRMAAELQDWLGKAQRHDPDACYVRVQTMVPANAEAILQNLAGKIPLIVPAKIADLAEGLAIVALHYSAQFLKGLDPLPARHPEGMPKPYSEGIPIPHPQGMPKPYLEGISCHSIPDLQAAQAAGFDYAFLSPVFSTATHPEARPLGLEVLKMASAQVQIPIIALGGITQETAAACLDAGAVGWAAIRAFMR